VTWEPVHDFDAVHLRPSLRPWGTSTRPSGANLGGNHEVSGPKTAPAAEQRTQQGGGHGEGRIRHHTEWSSRQTQVRGVGFHDHGGLVAKSASGANWPLPGAARQRPPARRTTPDATSAHHCRRRHRGPADPAGYRPIPPTCEPRDQRAGGNPNVSAARRTQRPITIVVVTAGSMAAGA
jgi:hypothetical protein